MSLVEEARQVLIAQSPFVGLNFFTEDNSAIFFGRDTERTVLISNLRVARLTLLYAQSGTGKSSILRAGAASRLAELARHNLDRFGKARNIPVVFSSWRDNPTSDLVEEIGKAVAPFVTAAPGPSHAVTAPTLEATIEAASRATDSTLLIMLDQFEEYFLYRPQEKPAGRFADELAASINKAGLRANFLIAIREDAYSGLGDLFKSRISDVYGNYLHLGNLTRECARQAIERPIANFNELHPDEQPVEIEPGLVDMVLDQLRPDLFAVDQAGKGRLGGEDEAAYPLDEIAAPYLQLVMKRLWDAEMAQGSRQLRMCTLTDDLGGAQNIVRTHVERALGDLSADDREAAADFLHHLVTPSGTKIALAATDIAEYTGRPADQADLLLERLSAGDTRILSPIPPAPGHGHAKRFEISHDLLAPAILGWGAQQRAARLEQEKEEAQRQVSAEKGRTRRFRALAIGSVLLLIIALIASFGFHRALGEAHTATNDAEARAIAVNADRMLSRNASLATSLALRSLKLHRTQEGESALRAAVPQLQLQATLVSSPPMRAAAFSANGKLVLAASADGTVQLWDAATHQPTATFRGLGTIDSAALSPDGAKIAVAIADGTTHVLDAQTGKAVTVLSPPGGSAVSSAEFSQDGAFIVTTYSSGDTRIWNTRTGDQTGRTLVIQGRVFAAAFSPDGKLLVTADESGNAQIWDIETGALLHVLNGSSSLFDAAFSPDGKRIVTACGCGSAQIWDASTGARTSVLAPPGGYRITSASFSSDGKQILTAGGDGAARIWDVSNDRLIRTLGGSGHDSLEAATFSHDGHQVVTASAGGRVRLWDPATGKQVALLRTVHGVDRLRSAIFSPGGTVAATGSQFGNVTLWKAPAAAPQTPNWKKINVIGFPEGEAINDLAFNRTGSLLAVAGQSGRAYFIRTPSGAPAGEDLYFNRPLNSVDFDPARPALVVVADDNGKGQIFNTASDKPVGRYLQPARTWPMRAAKFSPNGKLILASSADGYSRLFNPANQRQIGAKIGYGNAVLSASFSQDGSKVLVTSFNGYTYLWDIDKDNLTIRNYFTQPGYARPLDAAFSSDASMVFTAESDGSARGWDVASGKQVMAFSGHTGPVNSIAVHGSEIITASADGTADIWDALPVEQRGVLQVDSDAITKASFNPKKPDLAVTADADGKVDVWNTGNTKSPIAELTFPNVKSAEFSKDGKLLAVAGSEQVKVWETSNLHGRPTVINTAGCAKIAATVNAFIHSAMFSPDGSQLVTADDVGTACIWDLGTGQMVRRLIEPTGASGGVAGQTGFGQSSIQWAEFSPSGREILTVSNDGTVRIWDAASGRQLQVLSEPSGESLISASFSPDGKSVLTASNDGTARLWSTATGRLRRVFEPADQRSPLYNATFSHNGRQIVTCSDSASIIWNAVTGQQLTEVQPEMVVNDCEFSPNGREVIMAENNGMARIYSTELAGGLQQVERIARDRLAAITRGSATMAAPSS